jgi:hypothetical protein
MRITAKGQVTILQDVREWLIFGLVTILRRAP